MAMIAADFLAAPARVLVASDASRSTRSFSEPVKSAPINAAQSLQQLNKAFLSLAIRLAAGDSIGFSSDGFDVGLPATTLKSLRQLSDDALNRLANCPYALFELPLATAAPPLADEQRHCATAALFYAWHIAQTEPTRAQLWFCLDAKSTSRLRSLAALEVSAWADANSGSLRARLGNQACYWPAMIRAADTGDIAQLRLAQLLGRQVGRQATSPQGLT